MNRLLIAALSVLMMTSAQAKDWSVIRVGTEGAYAPFNYHSPDGTLRGFDVDVMQALCDYLKAKCEFRAMDFGGIILALQNDQIDAIATSMSVTEKRKKVVAFTNHYYTSYRRFIACGPAPADTSPAGMVDHSIGVQDGTAADDYLEAHYTNSIIRLYKSIDEVFMDLAAGRIETMLSGEGAAYYFMQVNPGCRFVSERIADPKLASAVAIAVRPADKELLVKLNEALAAIIADGTYEPISKKYFPFSIY